MKKIFLGIVMTMILQSMTVQAQYYVEVNVDWENRGDCFDFCYDINDIGSSNCPYNGCTLVEEYVSELRFYDNSDDLIFIHRFPDDTFTNTYTGILSERPYRIDYYNDFCEIIDEEGNTTCGDTSTRLNLSTGDCFSQSAIYDFDVDLFYYDETLNVPTTTPELCNEESIDLEAENDCHGYRYRWIGSTTSTTGGFVYSGYTTTGSGIARGVPLSRFLPNENYTGNLFVKAEISFDGGATYNEETNILIYNVTSCSPQLLDFDSMDALCSYTSDGSFSMVLDRDLGTNKKLVVSLFFYDPTATSGYSLLGQNDTTDLTNNGDGTFSYTWPGQIPVGIYYVRYQTYDTSTTNPVWASLENTDDSFTIGSPPVISFSSTGTTDVNCNGGSDGTITLSASGGVAGYQYQVDGGDWTDFNTPGSTSNRNGSHTITGLAEGDYTIKVRDANECTEFVDDDEKEISISITQPSSAVSISLNEQVDPTAYSYTDGSIDVTVSGGSGGYTYSWTDADGDEVGTAVDLMNVGDGTYTLTVTDSQYSAANSANNSGCIAVSAAYELEEPDLLEVTASEQIAINCYEGTGVLTASGSGGISPYTYQWQEEVAGTFSDIDETTDTASNLSTGNYKVIITDDNGITAEDTFLLSEPDELAFTYSSTDVSCNGGSDGTITITPSGGTPPYSYVWLDDSDETSNERTGLPSSLYIVTITDSNGCVIDNLSDAIVIGQPLAPVAITIDAFTYPTGNSLTNGSISATVSGGTSGYTYSWEDEDGTEVGTDEDVTNIGAGTYTLSVLDTNLCDETSIPVVIIEPEPLLVTLSETMVQCFEAADGTITANPTGGIPNPDMTYNYQWQKEIAGIFTDIPQTTQTAIDLDPGIYKVIVTDANGNSTEVPPVITPPIVIPSVEITQPELLEISSVTTENNICTGGEHGSISITVQGGTSPYTFTWRDSAGMLVSNTQNIEDLLADTYSVTIIDANLCEVEDSFDITEPDPVMVTYSAFSRPSTGGASDGWIEAQVSGGAGLSNLAYTYLWTDSDGTSLNAQTTTSFEGTANEIFQIRLSNIPAGTYFLTIEGVADPDSSIVYECALVESELEIYEPIEGAISLLRPISCNQDNTFTNPFSDGQLLATITGGVPFETGQPYLYYWKKQDASGTYVDLPLQTTRIATDLSAGNYALNVEDAVGNVIGIYDSATLIEATDLLYTFNEPDLLEVSLSSTPIACDAGNDGTASVAITGGIPPYEIEWSNGNTSSIITGLIAGKYLVYVTDARGCEATGQIEIAQPGGLEISIETQIDPTCYLGDDGQISVQVTGGTPPYSYIWNTGNTTTAVEGLSAGSYTFQITDAEGCIGFIDIELVDPDPILVDLESDRALCNGQAHELDITIEDDLATYQWNSDNGFTSNSSMVSLTEAGTYTAIVTTGLGCIGTDTIEITTSEVVIDSELVITSQAYVNEDVVVVNSSDPLSLETEWMVSGDSVEILEETNEKLVLRFSKPGAYEISLRSFQGDCYEDYTKSIIVNEARDVNVPQETASNFIQEFDMFPNPNAGEFTVSISLAEESNMTLRLFNLVSNMPLDTREESGSSNYAVDYVMNLPTGIYFLLLETKNESQIRKIVIE